VLIEGFSSEPQGVRCRSKNGVMENSSTYFPLANHNDCVVYSLIHTVSQFVAFGHWKSMGNRRRLAKEVERNSPRHDPWHHHQSESGGFTLIELLIVMVVTPLLVGALSLALIAMFQLQSSASDRLGATSSSQVVAANFYRDVQSATMFTTVADPSSPAPCGSGTQILGMHWNTSPGADTVVSYDETPSGATSPFNLLEYQLTRNQCTETLNTASESLTETQYVSSDVFNNLAVTTLGRSCPTPLTCSSGTWRDGWVTTTGITSISLAIDVAAANSASVDTNSNCPKEISFCFTLTATPRDWEQSGSEPVLQPIGNIIPAQFNGSTGTNDSTCNSNNPNMVVNGQLVFDSSGPNTVTGNKQDIYASPVDYYTPGGPPSDLGNGITPTPISSQVPDPLAPLQNFPPSTAGLPQYSTLASATARVVNVGGVTYTYVVPGVYNFNLVDPNGSNLVLESGEFILNQGVTGSITSGVGGDLIYEVGGQFAPATSNVWPMSSGIYPGISLWMTPNATMSLGPGDQQLDGVVYVPGGTFYWHGNSNIWLGELDADSASCSGGGTGQTNIGFTQSITFTSTSPTQVNVGDSYSVTVKDPATPNSGNPITVSTDPLSDSGACTVSNLTSTSTSAIGTVNFTGNGECLIDANQASSDQTFTANTASGGYAEAPTIQQIIQVGP
jgi:prepilin-type N-terminal cleavage/methylation domain-containing protein